MTIRSKKGQIRNRNASKIMGFKDGMTAHDREKILDALRMGMRDIRSDLTWKSYGSVPNKGPLEKMVGGFEKLTDAPLELPFYSVLFLIASYLLKKGSRLDCSLGIKSPELWTVVLAPSGKGKSLMFDTVRRNSPFSQSEFFPECASSASFFMNMKEENEAKGYSLWIQDEFGQYMRLLEQPKGPLDEMKGYLLKIYGNDFVQRTTRKDGKLSIEKPILNFLGLNTRDSYLNAVGAESMKDGFAQRFGVVFADEDFTRPMKNYARYKMKELDKYVAEFWKRISEVEIHDTYFMKEETEQIYDEKFKEYFTNQSSGFYRRVMFRAYKYAMSYHILQCDNSNIISDLDMELALKLVKRDLDDITKFIRMKTGFKEAIELAERAKKTYIEELMKGGKKPTEKQIARKVLMNNRDYFKNVDDALTYTQLLAMDGVALPECRSIP